MILRACLLAAALMGPAGVAEAASDPVAYRLTHPQATIDLGSESGCQAIAGIASSVLVDLPMADEARASLLAGGYDEYVMAEPCAGN